MQKRCCCGGNPNPTPTPIPVPPPGGSPPQPAWACCPGLVLPNTLHATVYRSNVFQQTWTLEGVSELTWGREVCCIGPPFPGRCQFCGCEVVPEWGGTLTLSCGNNIGIQYQPCTCVKALCCTALMYGTFGLSFCSYNSSIPTIPGVPPNHLNCDPLNFWDGPWFWEETVLGGNHPSCRPCPALFFGVIFTN